MKRRPFFLLLSLSILLGLLLLSQVLSNWSLFIRPGYASNVQAAHTIPPSFTYQHYLKQESKPRSVKGGPPSPYPQPSKQTTGAQTTTRPPSAEPATMQPINQPLTSSFLAGSASALDFKGNDGRLEVQLQAGSFDMSQATVTGGKAPSGSLTLQVTQIHGHSEGMLNQLGYYQAQVVDSQGLVVTGIKLHSPISIVYHYQPTELHGLNLNPSHILLDWPTLIASAQQAKQPTANLVIAMHDDPTAHTLTALSSVFGPGPFSLFADPQNQGDPSPHVAESQGNNGQLAYSYPLQVAPGTGGFAPQLSMNYSSMGPNDRHSAVSPANDEGDGWSLGLGSISMETYPTTPTATNWYFINGVDNVSDRLIYNSSTSLYYTEHLSYLRIQQLTVNGQPCFRVWDTSGTFYELGCTTDSLEYSVSGSTRYNYQWNVDRIVAPNQGPTATQYRMILATYLQDCSPASTSQPCPGTNTYTVRDAVLQQITYGSATSVTAPTLSSTAGTIDFTYRAPFSYTNGGVAWATAYTYGTGGNEPCTPAATTSLRCDDPVQLLGGFTPPDVMGTFSLDRITSYIGPDSGTGSYPAYGYTLTYTDTSFVLCSDPLTLTGGNCAGEHTLASITPHLYLQSTDKPRKSVNFSYSAYKNTYYDTLHQVPTGNPTQQYQNATNWDYLTSYIDTNTGIGEKNITYATAYSNTDGTPSVKVGSTITDDRFDALYCRSNANNPDPSLQCFQGNYLHPDDQAWSVQVITQISSSGEDSSALGAATTTYNYYRLAQTGTYVSGAWCHPDQYSQENQCVGDNWFANTDSDWADYYHSEFRGFNQVWHLSPAGDLTVDYYFSTEGWNKPATDPADYDAGQLLEEDRYQGGSYTASAMLQKTVNTYPGPYPNTSPSNNTTNPSACYTPSGSAPYAACDVMILSSLTTDYEGNSSGPSVTTNYTYDDYNPNSGGGLQAGYHNLTQEQVSTSNSNAPTVTHTWSYTSNDQTLNGWTYYTVNKATHSETDAGGHIYQCQDIIYDEGGPSTLTVPVAGWPTTVSTYSSANCITPRGSAISTSYSGYDAYGNPVATVDGVAAANSSLYNTNGCTLTTNPYVMSHNWTVSESRYTSCVTYDTYNAQPVTPANAFGQSSTTTFDYTQAALPTLLLDANGQQTSTSYSIDSSGNETVQTQLPLHTGSFTTKSITNSGCVSGSVLPCYEVDAISNQYNAVIARTFYDSLGRAIETRTPGPTSGYDTVVFTTYNDAGHSTFQSLPFLVTDGSGFIDPYEATDYQGNRPGGTGTYFDALGRVLAIKDPNFGQTQLPDQEPGLVCPAPLSNFYTDCTNYSLGTVSGDSNTYSVVTAIDPNSHATVSYLDPLGRVTYVQLDSGTFGGGFTANELKTIAYNVLNEPTSVTVTDEAPQAGQNITSVTNTTASYDDLGRLTGINDPDRGNHSYSYDADGQLITDVSGARTIGSVYDLLGRVGCVQNMSPTESATGACTSGATQYVKNTYDTTTLGTHGSTDFPVGKLTKSVATTRYPDNTNAQVSETYQHDKRGRLIDEQISFPNLPGAWNVTTALPSYKMQYTYNDADQVTTTTTSTNPAGQGYTTTQVYDSTTGALTGLSDNGTNTADLATLSFNAQAHVSSINYLTSTSSALAIDQFGYDSNLRPITDTANWQSGSGNGTAAIFSQSRSFDPGSNLTSLTTTHAAVPGATGSGGTETSNFCYDEQNRLVWAGNSGTQPGAGNGTCGSGTLSSGLNGASYSNSYVYTHLGQLYQAPLNGNGTQEQYLYCNSSSSKPHQLLGLYPTSSGATCANYTSKTADYSSSYDAFGNVTSRTFSGTTGTLSYDLLDHLTKWFVSSTNQEQYVYDAGGNRILRRSTNSSATTMTVYAFGLEEHVYSGAGVNQGNTYYYSLAGRLIGAKDANGTVFYMTDTLGSILASFTNTANTATLKGNQVYGPYGNARYSKGTINTLKGFTGQYNDSLTGLDYYNARYYDPVAGVFLSVDTKQGNMQGLNPYAYVDGNPETHNDPSGLRPIGVCPSGDCNTPVDMSALFAAIDAWSGIANANYKINPALTYVPPVTSVATGAQPSLYKDGSVQQTPLTSCGAPMTHSTCGNYQANLALYTPLGVASMPVELCLICGGSSGGSDHGGNSEGNSDLSAASNTEGALSNPPDGWEIVDYGSDNKAEIVDFTHTDESGNTLEASLYRKSGELQISWMDSLRQAKSHLPGLVNWLGDSVQIVKGYATDNFATYFSPESRGAALVNRMFSSVLEEAGFAQSTIELEGSKIWIVFRRIE